MAQLTVRNVDDEIVAAPKARAAMAGRSAEAEHRKILEEALRHRANTAFFEEARLRRLKPPASNPGTGGATTSEAKSTSSSGAGSTNLR